MTRVHQQASIDAFTHALAGCGGGMLAMSLLYPLENIRTRLQVQVREKEKTKQEKNGFVALNASDSTGPLDCLAKIMQEEGWQGLYNGLQSALVGVGLSSTLYFYCYNYFKSRFFESKGVRMNPIDNTLVAATAGCINVIATAPIWVITTRLTLQNKNEQYTAQRYSGVVDAFKKIVSNEGVVALYQGLVPSLILVTNPVIQFVCFEQFGRYVQYLNKKRGGRRLTDTQTFIIGAIAKAIATVVTYPYQVLKSRLQVKPNSGHRLYKNTSEAIKIMYREEGAISFYRGMSAKMLQTVLNSAFMFMFTRRIFSFIQKLVVLLRVSKYAVQ